MALPSFRQLRLQSQYINFSKLMTVVVVLVMYLQITETEIIDIKHMVNKRKYLLLMIILIFFTGLIIYGPIASLILFSSFVIIGIFNGFKKNKVKL